MRFAPGPLDTAFSPGIERNRPSILVAPSCASLELGPAVELFSILRQSYNFLQRQERFDNFIDIYNNDRPHQALNKKYPGELYTPSTREFHKPESLEYPFHDRTIRVTHCGRICFDARKIYLSRVFAGQDIGIREVSDKIWLVTFMEYDLGFFDQDEQRVEPAENPFVPKL